MSNVVMSEREYSKMQSFISRVQSGAAKIAAKKSQMLGEAKVTAEAAGAAAVMGYIRGMLEKQGKTMNIPYTTFDVEPVLAAAICATAMLDMYGKYSTDALAAGIGMASHYAGQVARNWGKTGQFTLVAGHTNPLLGHVGASPLMQALQGTL